MANNEAVLSEAVDPAIKRPSVQFINVPPIKDDENVDHTTEERQQGLDTVTRSTSVTKDATGTTS